MGFENLTTPSEQSISEGFNDTQFQWFLKGGLNGDESLDESLDEFLAEKRLAIVIFETITAALVSTTLDMIFAKLFICSLSKKNKEIRSFFQLIGLIKFKFDFKRNILALWLSNHLIVLL